MPSGRTACVTFAWANVTGSKWRTDKGLRVGASQSQVRELYKSATRKSSGGYTVWTLARVSGKSLQAWMQDGRIEFFRVVRTLSCPAKQSCGNKCGGRREPPPHIRLNREGQGRERLWPPGVFADDGGRLPLIWRLIDANTKEADALSSLLADL
jgi:hypothetical protein